GRSPSDRTLDHLRASPVAQATRKPATEPIAIDGNHIAVQYTPAIGQMFDAWTIARRQTPANTPPVSARPRVQAKRKDGRSVKRNAAGSNTSHFDSVSIASGIFSPPCICRNTNAKAAPNRAAAFLGIAVSELFIVRIVRHAVGGRRAETIPDCTSFGDDPNHRTMASLVDRSERRDGTAPRVRRRRGVPTCVLKVCAGEPT